MAGSQSACAVANAERVESVAAGIGAVKAEAGIGIGTGVAEDATDGAGNAVDGTAIAIDVGSPR